MSDQEDLERLAADGDDEALESLAKQAFEAGELVRYRELLQRANRWPPPAGFSGPEIHAIGEGDLTVLHTALERNGRYGSLDALYTLIDEAYEAGDGDVAREWFRRTAQFGDSQLLMILAGIAEAATDLVGERWCCEAAAELGDPDAMFSLGDMSEDAGDLEKAWTWYEQAGNLGSGDAMCALGRTLHGLEGDDGRSLAWLQQGASIGHAGAILYRYAVYPEHQIDFALQLRDQVAASLELDDLGGVLVEGLMSGVLAYPEDALWMMSPSLVECGDTEAAKRHRMVAQRRFQARAEVGDTEAMLNLGQLLIQDGEDKTGREWIEKSASLGYEGAVKALADLDDGTGG